MINYYFNDTNKHLKKYIFKFLQTIDSVLANLKSKQIFVLKYLIYNLLDDYSRLLKYTKIKTLWNNIMKLRFLNNVNIPETKILSEKLIIYIIFATYLKQSNESYFY